MPKILIPLADGFEDIEAIAVIDVLRRAGIEVVTAGATGNFVVSASRIRMSTDSRIIDMDTSKFDGIVLPGGSAGVENLGRNETLMRLVEDYAKTGKLVAAICMAPSLLAKRGILKDKKATAYPGLERGFDKPRADRVVVDENIITSQGPGTAVEFALKIVEQMLGKPKALQIKQQLVA